jgi:3-oxoacyl-[acyl-carrier protein] reductase
MWTARVHGRRREALTSSRLAAELSILEAVTGDGLAGRVAVVTGANHGIGAATAQLLAERGASVLLTYWRVYDVPDSATPETYRRQRAQTADTLVATIRERGGQAVAVEADLRDPATPPRLFDTAEAAFGPVAILINNASGWTQDTFKPSSTDRHGRRLRQLTSTTASQLLEVDARGSALMIAEFARRHVARAADWGRVVGLTSAGAEGFPEEVSYGAAKAALTSYHLSAALELASYGITSNVVHPPVTDTGWVTPSVRELVATSQRHVHVAQPEDVAEVVVYLCSERSRLITANVLTLR